MGGAGQGQGHCSRTIPACHDVSLLPLAISPVVCSICESGRGRWCSSRVGPLQTIVSWALSGCCRGKTGIKRKAVESPDREMHLDILWGQSQSWK